MPTVTVDADDLEALLFSTGAIKDVEYAIAGRARDPLVKSATTKLAGAHDRAAAAWRRAKRAEPEAPAPNDIVRLRALFVVNGEIAFEAVTSHYPQRLVQDLLLVESGPIWDGIKIDWPAPATPEFRPAPSAPGELRYAVRLTPRGEDVLRAAVAPARLPAG
jgi:hypothetical protein